MMAYAVREDAEWFIDVLSDSEAHPSKPNAKQNRPALNSLR